MFDIKAPGNFPLGSMYTVEKGVGLNSLAADLAGKNIIRSPFWFKVFSVLSGGTKGIIAGDYVLNTKNNVIVLADRLANADYRLEQIKITFPEGLSIFEVAKTVSTKFPKITEGDFVAKAKNLEGYLFPDTYFFEINVDEEVIIKALQDNFQKKILSISDLFKNFNKKESDVIKMASIIEEEARTMETRQIIAGILWRRLALEMPLQVDASFKYINGKGTKDLTLDDLKIDSPYNSYLYRGLPPTPICNPGLDSITATLTPVKTDYLYFLTDKEGNMHYAKTFAEHVLNKQKYLP